MTNCAFRAKKSEGAPHFCAEPVPPLSNSFRRHYIYEPKNSNGTVLRVGTLIFWRWRSLINGGKHHQRSVQLPKCPSLLNKYDDGGDLVTISVPALAEFFYENGTKNTLLGFLKETYPSKISACNVNIVQRKRHAVLRMMCKPTL